MTETPDAPTGPTCTHCGKRVSAAGRRPFDGRWFCSDSRPCINARQALRRRQKLGEVGLETRPCSHCGAHLRSRPKRSTDSPLGRWCRTKYACQEARERFLTLEAEKARIKASKTPEDLAHEEDQLNRAYLEGFKQAHIIRCTKCGREDARAGFNHPTADLSEKKFCNGDGSFNYVKVHDVGNNGPLILEAAKQAWMVK